MVAVSGKEPSSSRLFNHKSFMVFFSFSFFFLKYHGGKRTESKLPRLRIGKKKLIIIKLKSPKINKNHQGNYKIKLNQKRILKKRNKNEKNIKPVTESNNKTKSQ